MTLLKENNVELEGKEVVIVGKGKLVGRPLINALFDTVPVVWDAYSNAVYRLVTGVKFKDVVEIKEDDEINKFDKANKKLSKVQLFVLKLFSYMNPISNLILNFTIIAVIYIGSINVKSDIGITTGNIIAAVTYTSIILGALLRMANLFQTWSRAQVSVFRINQVLNCLPVINDGEFNGDTKVKGKLELRNVSFAYPDSPKVNVLEDLNLVINPGEDTN